MVYQSFLEGACQYLVLMVYEGLDTFVLQLADDTAAHIDNLFVGVCQLLVLDTLQDALLHLVLEESQHQP